MEVAVLDPLISNLINFGIGGCMAALVVWHVWYTQTKQIPTLLVTFEKQMDLERVNSDSRAKAERESHDKILTTERQIAQMRHEENIAQSTLLLSSLRETHHAIRNLANSVKLHHARIDVALGMKLGGHQADDADEVIESNLHRPNEPENKRGRT